MIADKFAHERRRAPRLANNIPVKLCQEDGDLVTETVNISRSGAYCTVSRYIEPMTKIKTHLLLPVTKNGNKTTKKISCTGIVVRIAEIPSSEQYNVAVFFNDISQRDADAIADYINTHIDGAE